MDKEKRNFNRNSFAYLFTITVASLLLILSGCTPSTSVDEETFEEKYAATQKKYEKYLNGPVSGQEVLELIDKWDETDFEMTVEYLKGSRKGKRFRVSNLDANNARVDYWNNESIYYIDPDAFYEGGFMLFEPPGRVYQISIGELYFSLVEDSDLSDDNTTD